jgi:hypothetical protein
VNSEELEVSLRAEFEQHLKTIRSEMKQQLAAFQNKIDSEFTKHKSQINDAFGEFSARFDAPADFDKVLHESVIEHLRLARDNGAQLAASAAAEAEKLSRDHAASVAGFDQLRDAVSAISSQTTQAGILKTLTDYATRFAPRGAFFIIKNDQFIGWQVFGSQPVTDEGFARSISFSVDTDSILGSAVRCLSAQQGSFGLHSEDGKFLKPLDFGKPKSMVAIPLIARGRGVAVLYADAGDESGDLNVGALETLVRIAGVTVELQAAAQAIRTHAEVASYEPQASHQAVETPQADKPHEQVPETSYVEEPQPASDEPAYFEEAAIETVSEEVASPVEAFEPVREEFEADVIEEVVSVEPEVTLDDEAYLMTDTVDEVVYTDEIATVEESSVSTTDFAFASDEPPIAPEEPVHLAYDDGVSNGNGAAEPETKQAEPAFNGRGRRDRNVDLPIEVSEQEREDHTKARKFARLLVSEIKLYNEKQVREGREANDLYDRLREAVDRSREMYNKRVVPPVAEKFDYFHYELVNGLADGDESRLGNNYPGSGR